MLSNNEVRDLQREIPAHDDEQLPAVFNALSDTGRFRIFKLLMRYQDLCVTDIANIMDISVPAASQQLKVLELSGLVTRDRQGQKICYCIKSTNPLVKAMIRVVTGINTVTARNKYRN